MLEIPIKIEATVPTNDHWLWSNKPAFSVSHPNQMYGGRVFVEVWEDNAQLVCDDLARRWLKEAAYALRLGSRLGTYEVAILPQELTQSGPATQPAELVSVDSTIGEQKPYLGRIIIEAWNGKLVVGVSGDEERVKKAATIILEQTRWS